MWKRTCKNAKGAIQNVICSNDWGKPYSVEPLDYTQGVKYRVEYLPIANYKAWEDSQKKESSLDPWELLDSYETDLLSEAVKEFALREIDASNPVLFVTLPDGKELTATMPSHFGYLAKMAIINDKSSRISDLERQVWERDSEIERLRKELSILRRIRS